MSFNGSGLFSLSDTLENGTLGDASEVNAILTDLAAGLSKCLTKDGQQTVTANIPMNGFRLTGVGAGQARTDSATLANLQDGTGIYVTQVGGTVNAVTLLPSPAISAYATGQNFRFMVTQPNDNSVTVAVSGLTAKPLYSRNGTEVIDGDLRTGDVIEIYYDASAGSAGAFILGGGGFQSQLTSQTLDSCLLNFCSVVATPVASTDIPNKDYVDALWTTGDVKVTLKTTADSGWVMFDDGTIGSASSAATTRANADTSALFTLLWTNTTNTNCAVSSGRGTSAAADFAANKTIALPKVLGRALAVAGSGSGLSSRALAQVLGSENAINVSHTHTATQSAHSHTYQVTSGGAGAFTGTVTAGADSGSPGGGPTATSTPAISVSTDGSSGTGANMPPTSFFNIMVKL